MSLRSRLRGRGVGQDGQAASSSSGLPCALASLAFNLLALSLVRLYGRLHWGLLFGTPTPALPDDARQELTGILDDLGWNYRGLALLGLLFAVWSLRGHPRWAGVAALVVAAVVGVPLLVLVT